MIDSHRTRMDPRIEQSLFDSFPPYSEGTAEMGPLKFLLQCGATVVVVARKNSTRQPEKWSDLLHTAHRSCGTLYFPLTKQVQRPQ